MHVINKLTLHRGSKSVTLFVRDEDTRHLIAAANALGVDWRSVAYARKPTPADAWSSFLRMRLALHEHVAAPSAALSSLAPHRHP